MDKNKNNGCAFYFGGGIWGILFIIMFVMKTMGLGVVANWSWWWVTAPLWGPVALSLLIVIGFFVISFILAIISHVLGK